MQIKLIALASLLASASGAGTGVGNISTIVAYCAVSTMVTAALCIYARAFGAATDLIDRPDGVLKLHSAETPLIGGLALLLPSFTVSFVYFSQAAPTSFMVVALTAALVILVVGVIDDRYGLSPVFRLGALALVVFLVFATEPLLMLHALRFGVHGDNFGVALGIWAAPITALMIIGFVNASNMADGMNGQLLGSVLIWSIFLSQYLGFEVGMPFIAIICSAAVTLAFNLKGRLFSGSSGSYAASLFVALGTIAAYRQSENTMPAEEPVFWFWLPVLDCVRLMVSRVAAGKSPLFGDRNHIHHILQDYARWPYALVIYLGLLAAPGVAAMFNDLLGGVMLGLCIAVYATLLVMRKRVQAVREASLAGPATGAVLAALATPRSAISANPEPAEKRANMELTG